MNVSFRRSGQSSFTRVSFVISGVLLLVAGAIPATAAAEKCQPGLVRDYLAPLSKLPHVPTLEWSNTNLPFGPDGLVLIKKAAAQRGQPLVPVQASGDLGPEESALGYELRNDSFVRSGRLQLNWKVQAQLALMRHGPKPIATRTRRIGALRRNHGKQFQVPVPTSSGIYRLEIRFRARGGKLIGRIGEYFRVLPASYESQITLSAQNVRLGETLDACLENLGTQALYFGPNRQIEVFDGVAWKPSPIDPPAPSTASLSILASGRRIPLISFTVPADAAPGTYRYRWQAEGGLTLAPEFQIVP